MDLVDKKAITQKLVEDWINENKEYEKRQFDHNTHKIIEAISKATNGTFLGEGGTSTLMGWVPKYDDEGRALNADPNYVDTSVTIEDVTYHITRVGWRVYIWLPNSKANYCTTWSESYKKYLLTFVDLTPDYVHEHRVKENTNYVSFNPITDNKEYEIWGELILNRQKGVCIIENEVKQEHYVSAKWISPNGSTTHTSYYLDEVPYMPTLSSAYRIS